MLNTVLNITSDCWLVDADHVNKKQLRAQFTRLALLRACGVLFSNQDKLRHILLQLIPPEQLSFTSCDVMPPTSAQAAELEASGAATPDDESSTPEAASAKLLMHQLMLSATQPSPIKSTFTREELEVRMMPAPYYCNVI